MPAVVTMTDNDPIRNVDVGTTRTVTETDTYYLYAPDVYFGSDRDVDNLDVTDIEAVPPERDGDYPTIEVTWQGDVTKQLGRRWDEHDQPVTDAERRRARWERRITRWSPPAVTGVVLGVGMAISKRVMNRLAGELTINGEPMAAPTMGDLWVPVLLVFALAAIIVYGLQGGLPRGVGR